MGQVNPTTATLPGMDPAHAGGAGHSGAGPQVPPANDPRFIAGSVGEFGQSKTIKQQDGPGFNGIAAEKNQNGNDKEQNNYGVTDANFTNTLGVIADPDTGKPMSYLQTMQAYNAAGAIEGLAPQVYAKLVANQDAGRGTVLGGALSLLGVTTAQDPAVAGLTQQDIAAIPQALPGLGNVKDLVLNPNDFKGREWNRAHHSGSYWKGMTDLVNQGMSWDQAALLTGDSMTSWSGRVLGSNNQDGNASGFADDELAGLKYMVIAEQATGKDILTSVLGAHGDTHLPADQLTDPKINKLIGFPPNDRSVTPQKVQAIRQWAMQSNVQVDQGEFNKFMKAAPPALAQQVQGSGLLNQVVFESKDAGNGGGGGGGNGGNGGGGQANAATTPTGPGTGAPIGAGAATPAGGVTGNAPTTKVALPAATPAGQAAVGAATATDPPVAAGGGAGAAALTGPGQANAGASLTGAPLVDAITNSKLSQQDQAALIDALTNVHRASLPPAADPAEEEARKQQVGAAVNRITAKSGGKLSPAQIAIRDALKDGNLTAAERTALEAQLGPDGKKALDQAVGKDGKVTLAGAEQLLGTTAAPDTAKAAADSELARTELAAALADGKVTAAEKQSLTARLGAKSKALVDKLAGKDGKVDPAAAKQLTTKVDAEAKAAAAKPATIGPDGKPIDPKAPPAPGAPADPKAPAAAGTPSDPKATTATKAATDPKAPADPKAAADPAAGAAKPTPPTAKDPKATDPAAGTPAPGEALGGAGAITAKADTPAQTGTATAAPAAAKPGEKAAPATPDTAAAPKAKAGQAA